jgi:hypothetical protein
LPGPDAAVVSRNGGPLRPSLDTTLEGRVTGNHADPFHDWTTGKSVFPPVELAKPTAQACRGPAVATPNRAVSSDGCATVATVRQPGVPAAWAGTSPQVSASAAAASMTTDRRIMVRRIRHLT